MRTRAIGDLSVPVEACDRETWERCAQEVDPGFYGSPAWLEIICAAWGFEPTYVLVTTHNRPALRLALCTRRRWRGTLLLTPPLAAYAGYAEKFPDDLSPERIEQRRDEAFAELAEWCERQASYVRIVVPPEVSDVRPFISRGWRTELRYTYRIDLADGAPDLRTNARRNLERAESAGLTVLHPHGDDAASFLDITLRATFARQKEPLPVPPSAWDAYLRSLVSLPNVRVAVVTDGRTPQASAVVGYDSRRSYELHAGTTDEGTTNGASVLALWTAIRESAGQVREFDFAGANVPGIARFKRGFGGKLLPYVAVTWARSASARWLAQVGPHLKRKLTGILGR